MKITLIFPAHLQHSLHRVICIRIETMVALIQIIQQIEFYRRILEKHYVLEEIVQRPIMSTVHSRTFHHLLADRVGQN